MEQTRLSPFIAVVCISLFVYFTGGGQSGGLGVFGGVYGNAVSIISLIIVAVLAFYVLRIKIRGIYRTSISIIL